MCRRIQIDFLTFFKTIDDIAFGIVHFSFCLGSCPEEIIAIGHPKFLHLAWFLRSFIVDKGHKWLKRRREVVVVLQFISKITFIAHHSCRIPQATTRHVGEITLQLKLCRHLIDRGVVEIACSHRTLHVLTNNQGTTIGVARPPTNQTIVVGCLMSDFPIELWHHIVHPTLVHPIEHIGIKVVIVLQTARFASWNVASSREVMIDAEGRNPKFHPRFHAVHCVVEHLHKGVYIISAPLCFVLNSIAIGLISSIILNHLTSCWIGVEIIVDVQAVYIIATHDVGCNFANVALIFHHTRIKNQQSIIAKEAFRIFEIRVRSSQFVRTFCLRTKGINPCVQLHATIVTLINHPSQRIPTWVATLLSGEEFAPRFKRTLIKCIGFGAHLKHHRIDATSLQHIELMSEIGLHLLSAHALKLTIDTLNPGTAHLAFRTFKGILRTRHEVHHKEEEEKERFFH